MSNYNEDEENHSINDKRELDKLESKDFETVPIEDSSNNSIEIFNVYKGIDLSKVRFKRKINQILLVILVVAIVFLMFKILNISPLFSDDNQDVMFNNDNDNNQDNFNDQNFDNNDDDEEYNNIYDEYFYVDQDKDKINIRQLSSTQLKNPDNIKLVDKLQISLNLEYDKFVHMKIKDAENKRWEVPEKEVLDKDYLLNKNDNLVEFSKYSKVLDSQFFYIEIIANEVNKTSVNETEEGNEKKEDEEEDEEDFDEEGGDYNGPGKKYVVEDFSFRLMTQENEEFFYFSTKDNFIFSDTYINFESKLTSDNIYGFGERTHDFKLNDGVYTIWPYDCGGTKYDDGKGGMNQYSHQPIGLHKTKFENLWLGFVFLNTNAQDVVIRTDKDNTYLSHKTIGGIIDYYIIVNDSPEEIIKNIQTLLGIPPLPPFWSFGNHQSRYGYNSGKDFIDVYEKYKKSEIPIDSMWLDIDALDNFQMFTLNSKFTNIVNYIANTIHADGGKFVPIVDIGFSDDKSNQYIKLGNKLDIFIKSNYTKKNLIGKVWPGKTVFPDFFHPDIETFWNQGLNDYYKILPYDGIWLDMNEPTNLLENGKCIGEIVPDKQCTEDKNMYNEDDLPYIPGYRKNSNKKLSDKSISENALIYGNKTIYDVKPMISLLQTKVTYNYLNNNNEAVRPFILSRSTSLGSGKYTYHWLGDNLSTFANLKNSISGIFNFNIFGIPFTGSDICGFMDNASKDLCIRWYNLGIFYPFMRNHNFFQSKDQYPWTFGDDALKIINKNIKLRYSLIRYIYSQFFLISLNEKGSFFKPLMFEFPDDETSYENIEDKIMVGESLFLCAFYDNSIKPKSFKFPNANFNKFPEGKTVTSYIDHNSEIKEKNKIIELSGNLEDIHLFVRGGFIVPYQNVNEKYVINTKKLRNEKINLIINIDYYNQSKGELFYDNDEINTIEENKYYRVEIFYSEKKLTFNTFKNNLDSYEYQDHILGKIELWRASQIFVMNDKNEQKTKMVLLNIKYADNSVDENIEGIYDLENDKIVFDVSNNDKKISIFNINEITFN